MTYLSAHFLLPVLRLKKLFTGKQVGGVNYLLLLNQLREIK